MTKTQRAPIARRLARRGRAVARRVLRGRQEAAGLPASDLDLLVGSVLFDDEWYAFQTGVRRTRAEAAAHYLASHDPGAARPVRRPTPHPLFDPEFYVTGMSRRLLSDLGETDPFVFYLRGSGHRRHTHRLFDATTYLLDNVEARSFPFGPLAHYEAVGAAAGIKPNDWLRPGADGRYPDLRAWVRERHQEARRRSRTVPAAWRPGYDAAGASAYAARFADATLPTEEPLVTVVLDAGLDADLLDRTLAGLRAQTDVAWEVVAVDHAAITGLEERLAVRLGRERVSVVPVQDEQPQRAFAAAVDSARGRFLAFARAGEVWEPGRLRLLAAVATTTSTAAVVDVLAREAADRTLRYASHHQPTEGLDGEHAVEASRLLVDRRAVLDAGGIDVGLRGSWLFDLVMRVLAAHPVEYVPVLGTRRLAGSRRAHTLRPSERPPVDHPRVAAWADVALNRALVPWAELEQRPSRPGVVSVIIPTYDDSLMTWDAVASVVESGGVDGREVEVIVWDNGSGEQASAVLDALPLAFEGAVTLLHSPVNHGFALGNNLALAHATGEVVVFLNNDTTVPAGWLDPLVGALRDDAVLAAQSLLVYPSGAVQSAGVVFPANGGLPYPLLQGFPVEDAAGIETLDLAALTGAALAVRRSDAVALRGFDPLFRNGMEDVDLCHRLRELRPGVMRVLADRPVVHHESRTAGRYARHILNRALYLDRWEGVVEPRDDVPAWASRGYTVVDHEIRPVERHPRRLLVPEPVLVRSARLEVHERPGRLRWAVKNPAPAGEAGEHWGDTHFARAVAGALRELGQKVVIDHRLEFERATSRHDDVALVLRGVEPFRPSPEQVSIGWVISHPEMLARSEAAAYDRLVAASVTWSAQTAARWGIRVEPLLQATDPALFHPDRAVPDTGHPVLFVGSSRTIYRQIVKDAVEAGLPLSVYGDTWLRFIPKRYRKAQYLPNEELGAAYRSAGVVLNDHWDDMREAGFLSNRLFDAVASGARVITDDVAGLRDVFGDSVQVYRTQDDLVRLSSLPDPSVVFGDDEAIRATAAKVHREHSFRARAERLLEIAIEERKRRGFSG